jgi:hypothetical protein
MPDIWYDVSASLSSIPVNKVALLDDSDAKTRLTTVSASGGGVDLTWNWVTTDGQHKQAAISQTSAGADYVWRHLGDGLYGVSWKTSANSAPGFGWFTGVATSCLPWAGPVVGFRAAALNNTLVDDATQILTARDIGQLFESAITSVESQLIFETSADIVSNSAWIGNTVTIQDVTTGETVSRWVTAADATNEKITINASCPFTVAAGDIVRIESRADPRWAIENHDTATSAGVSAAANAVNVAKFAGVTIIGSGSANSLFRTSGT